MNWKPKWYVSYSGKRGVTLECVNKVKDLLARDPEKGLKIDQQMRTAVELAEKSLQMNESEGLELMKQSMHLAKDCFDQWGLTVQSHVQWLLDQGAIAVKPTGSGDGGYVLSLWTQNPSLDVQNQLISCL